MNSRAMKWLMALAVIVFVAFTAGLASAQNGLGLAAVGAPDPAHGFPKWYMDRNGLQLAPCLTNDANDSCGLRAAGALPNPAAAVSFPLNFPDELFYNRATARISGIGGGTGRADLGISLEGAFGGATGTVADGAAAEVVFARFRLRVTGGLVPGATYTLTAPFGTRNFVASATGTINFTQDQGCLAAPPACDFTLALATTNIGPFLQWNAGAPAGFIGHPAIDHAIIGSPVGTNIFRLKGNNVGGPGVGVVETNLFSITGQIFVRGSTTTTLTSTPNPSTTGQAVTLSATVSPVAPATGVPTGTVAFRDGATTIGTATLVNGSASISVSTLAAGSHSLTAVYSGSLDFLGSTSAVVTQVVNGAPAPPPPAATDTVTINLAQQVISTGELRVEGVNGRTPAGGFAATDEIHDGAASAGACPGALIGTASVGAADGKWVFRTVTGLRPTTVCVKSAGGGVASRAVTQK